MIPEMYFEILLSKPSAGFSLAYVEGYGLITNLVLTAYNKFVIIISEDRKCAMFDIKFYEDEHGYSDVKAFIKELREKSSTSKDARINFNKVVAYIDILEEMGTRIGEPVTKHLDGEIWELRPISNRILYAYVKDNTFVLLHHFQKKTQKTPAAEIEKAKRELEDYKRRYE